jgi:hypothetical protein
VDQTRSILLALAGLAKETQLRWEAGRAAVRARGQTPGRMEAFAHHVIAQRCLLTALRAADPPPRFTVRDVRLSRDPVRAATQLEEIAYAHVQSGQREAAHEPARLAYTAAYAEPVTDQEQHQVEILGRLPAARRDKIFDLAEQHARSQQPGTGR